MGRLYAAGIDVARILTDAHRAGAGVEQAVAAAAARTPAPRVPATAAPGTAVRALGARCLEGCVPAGGGRPLA
ncbi:hypothetical protein [Streptomyces erythrochromogenes]|uniref:hypothetical protein n=1 Tax=Streptomyces erythrochromogenes TaxID=285574 RepID=UPI0036D0D0FB